MSRATSTAERGSGRKELFDEPDTSHVALGLVCRRTMMCEWEMLAMDRRGPGV